MGCGASHTGDKYCDNCKLTQNKLQAHTAKGYLVSCMDFRLIEDYVKFMTNQGYNVNYDQFILAGGSLGLTQDKFPHWGQTLIDHMGIGKALHHFREIIFIDHLDCGAYKKFYPQMKTKEEEEEKHKYHMQMARDVLARKFPTMKFKGYLMDLNGDCKEMHIQEKVAFSGAQASELDNFLAGIKKNRIFSLRLF